jgi:hypothetical protein
MKQQQLYIHFMASLTLILRHLINVNKNNEYWMKYKIMEKIHTEVNKRNYMVPVIQSLRLHSMFQIYKVIFQ